MAKPWVLLILSEGGVIGEPWVPLILSEV
jgi:hypothetical protein